MMLAKRPPVKQILVLSEELTEDAAGPRFGTVKEPGEGRYAGDYPPIYEEGFVSSISSSYLGSLVTSPAS